MKRYIFFGMIFLLLVACQQEEPVVNMPFPLLMEIPDGFPDIPSTEENEFTEQRWKLGKHLFFDPIMSVDSSISCASCHQPELAFSDDIDFSLGVDQRLGTRNSPSLANVAYHPYLTREGGVPTLEMQVLVPIQEHNEFDFNIVLLAERLQADSMYVQMALNAYDRQPDPFVITRALACFERSLLSGNSLYDQHNRGEVSLSPPALRGKELFFSERIQCSNCHGGFNFTNYDFANNGLYTNYSDEGRFRLTGEDQDRAVFKVPSLRNIELSAPYMHDGSLSTLEAVIAHYNSGGKEHTNKSPFLQPLLLNSQEKEDLVAFLKSLTDYSFIENPIFKQE
ncbi:MAG: cytochrome-c peroxidase [Lewinella sp.]|jgi:cytochrome c peroxidase|uniref:cytochrome-c peroxidase n=1 Tax=Lewinella sp. TaxID=2004506 RepID=UPI003D6A8AA1